MFTFFLGLVIRIDSETGERKLLTLKERKRRVSTVVLAKEKEKVIVNDRTQAKTKK